MNIIVSDLLHRGKVTLLMLAIVLLSAILTVTTTYYTRQLIDERERILLEKNALDIEWRNLIIEENVLNDHSRVERISIEKLKMQHVDRSKENIVIEP